MRTIVRLLLSCVPRTIDDPEFPGEDEFLFFVMVEFNVEDIKELKRITTLELQGTLDADGVKQFVEVTYRDIIHPASLEIW